MKKLLLLIPLFLAILACNFFISRVPASAPPAQATFTAKPLNATLTGKLSYPSEFLPPMRVVLFSLTDKKAYFVDTAKGQGEYSIEVPAGTYYLVSYLYEGTAGNTGQVESYTLGGGPFAGGSEAATQVNARSAARGTTANETLGEFIRPSRE